MARLKDDEVVKDQHNPTSFSAPVDVVHEAVRDSSSYSERVKAQRAKTDSLKGKGKPLGGAPPLPPGKLEKLTMPKPDFGTEEPEVRIDEPPDPKQQVPGVGSAYNVNQSMASGDTDGPVSLSDAKKMKRKLSPQTEEALKAMDENVRAAVTESPPETAVPIPAPTFDAAPEKDEASTRDDKDDLNKADKDLERAPMFDIEGMIRARNSLLSEERRKAIEERLEDLDIADMVTKREIQQVIPVVKGRLSFTVRTLNQAENLFCLQYTYEFPGSEAYLNEMLNTAKMVCSLVAVNAAMLPVHMGDNDEPDRDLFQKKWDQVVRFPVQLVGDLSVQLIWFQNRVNDLFNIDNLKNG
jgi:hypothetical protein